MADISNMTATEIAAALAKKRLEDALARKLAEKARKEAAGITRGRPKGSLGLSARIKTSPVHTGALLSLAGRQDLSASERTLLAIITASVFPESTSAGRPGSRTGNLPEDEPL